MEAIKYAVHNTKGAEVGTIDLDPDVFGAPILEHLVHDTVRWQLARRRAGTHQALTRTMKEGGAKKPWRQKGTGRARAGSSISPIWVGGASVHGPLPRSYDYRLPKRTRSQALKSVLSERVAQKRLVVVDEFAVTGKTREMAAILKNLSITGSKAVMVVADDTEATVRSARNLPNVTLLSVAGVNVYDLMRHPYLFGTKASIEALERRVGRGDVE